MPRRPKRSPAIEQAFANLPRIKWPMAPDVVEPPIIKSADDLIEAATIKDPAHLDCELAVLQERLRRRSSPELRGRIALVRDRRDRAQPRDLLELIDLAEMPPEFMGWA